MDDSTKNDTRTGRRKPILRIIAKPLGIVFAILIAVGCQTPQANNERTSTQRTPKFVSDSARITLAVYQDMLGELSPKTDQAEDGGEYSETPYFSVEPTDAEYVRRGLKPWLNDFAVGTGEDNEHRDSRHGVEIGGTYDRKTGKRLKFFWAEIGWQTRAKAHVKSGWSSAPLAGASYEYRLEKKNGRWRVKWWWLSSIS